MNVVQERAEAAGSVVPKDGRENRNHPGIRCMPKDRSETNETIRNPDCISLIVLTGFLIVGRTAAPPPVPM